MSIDCEIWTHPIWMHHSGARHESPLNARFAVLPRIGEQIKISIHGITQEQFVVTSILHTDLDLHGNDARPSVQLWVETPKHLDGRHEAAQ
jgi:hypothetical protein